MARKHKKSKGRKSPPTANSNGSGDGAGVAASEASASPPSDPGGERFDAVVRAHVERLEKIQLEKKAKLLEKLLVSLSTPLPVLAENIRDGLRRNGTDVVQNDNDRVGDGDQSLIEGKEEREFHNELFTTGGDLRSCLFFNTMSPFASAALAGDLPKVKEMLEKAEATAPTTTGDDGAPPSALIALLETRETSLRLCPLLFIVAVDWYIGIPTPGVEEGIVEVTKLLLKYGARPDARDLMGKTVFHYGAGAYGSDMTLTMADLCQQAHDGKSYLFGKLVTLVGLSTESMNGRQGIALGFDVDSGRRIVSLADRDDLGRRKKVTVKPENLILAAAAASSGEEENVRPLVRLCDMQDRFGDVCITEAIAANRVHVAKFLLDRRARIDIVNSDGGSPLSEAMSLDRRFTEVGRLIIELAASVARRDRRKLCSTCGKDEKNSSEAFDLCAGWCVCCAFVGLELDGTSLGPLPHLCRGLLLFRRVRLSSKVMRYCSRECQLRHWKASHKLECRSIQAKKEERVVLDRPPAGLDCGESGGYGLPQSVQVGEKFTIKVQILEYPEEKKAEDGILFIHNEAWDCAFFMRSSQAGAMELFDVVMAEKATDGSVAFMKAMFDAEGNCVAFPGDTTMHSW